MPGARPPRLARTLLSRLLPGPAREFVIGDLDEEYRASILPERGPAAARLWYWRQALASLRAARRARFPLPEHPRPPSQTMEDTLQDIRFALRSWLRQPTTMAIAIVALAFGIGANTAIFSVVYGVLVRPLPYPEPDRLMTVWLDNRLQGWHQDVTSYPNFEDWAAWNDTFSGMAALSSPSDTITGLGEPVQVRATQASPTFFAVLGVEPLLGRTFDAADWESDERVVVLSYGAWQRRHGGDPDVIGSTLSINGTPHTVIGVMPRGFHYLREDVEHWRLFPSDVTASSRGQLWLQVVGRLKPGVSPEQAQADMDRVGRRLEEESGDFNEGYGVNVVPLREELVGDVRPALLVLLGAVGLVLLIACANVANLLLTRAIARRREIAVRAALGASGGRIARQTLTESMLLALLGGGAGVGIALLGLRLLRGMQPHLPRFGAVGIDVPVLLFTLGTALLTGLVFGAVPALHARAADLSDALRDRSSSAGAGGGKLRSGLVVAEIALALVLLVGAGLLIRSYASLLAVPPGFDPRNVLTFRVSLSGPRYQSAEDARVFFEDVLGRLRSLPGATAAAGVWHLPLGSGYSSGYMSVEGRPVPPRDEMREIKRNRVTPGYFEAVGTPVLAGRVFRPADTADAEPVAVVNQSFAELMFPAQDPVGQRVLMGTPDGYASAEDPNPELPWIRVIGVVGDTRQRALARPADPEVFLVFDQSPTGTLSFVLRSDGDPTALAAAARQQVWAVDPELPVAGMETLADVVRRDTSGERFNLSLVAMFAGLALVLATIGIYGVVSYWVGQQTREIGVRMALGARAGDVVGMVVRHTAAVTLTGVAVGLIGALLTTRLMSSLLFGVGPLDPLTFVAVSVLAAVIALATSIVPARRATGIDPIEALRDE